MTDEEYLQHFIDYFSGIYSDDPTEINRQHLEYVIMTVDKIRKLTRPPIVY